MQTLSETGGEGNFIGERISRVGEIQQVTTRRLVEKTEQARQPIALQIEIYPRIREMRG